MLDNILPTVPRMWSLVRLHNIYHYLLTYNFLYYGDWLIWTHSEAEPSSWRLMLWDLRTSNYTMLLIPIFPDECSVYLCTHLLELSLLSWAFIPTFLTFFKHLFVWYITSPAWYIIKTYIDKKYIINKYCIIMINNIMNKLIKR